MPFIWVNSKAGCSLFIWSHSAFISLTNFVPFGLAQTEICIKYDVLNFCIHVLFVLEGWSLLRFAQSVKTPVSWNTYLGTISGISHQAPCEHGRVISEKQWWHRINVNSNIKKIGVPCSGQAKMYLSRKAIFRRQEGIAAKLTCDLVPIIPEELKDRVFLQNLPSIITAHVLGPNPDSVVLDMCAAPGGNSWKFSFGVFFSCILFASFPLCSASAFRKSYFALPLVANRFNTVTLFEWLLLRVFNARFPVYTLELFNTSLTHGLMFEIHSTSLRQVQRWWEGNVSVALDCSWWNFVLEMV